MKYIGIIDTNCSLTRNLMFSSSCKRSSANETSSKTQSILSLVVNKPTSIVKSFFSPAINTVLSVTNAISPLHMQLSFKEHSVSFSAFCASISRPGMTFLSASSDDWISVYPSQHLISYCCNKLSLLNQLQCIPAYLLLLCILRLAPVSFPQWVQELNPSGMSSLWAASFGHSLAVQPNLAYPRPIMKYRNSRPLE